VHTFCAKTAQRVICCLGSVVCVHRRILTADRPLCVHRSRAPRQLAQLPTGIDRSRRSTGFFPRRSPRGHGGDYHPILEEPALGVAASPPLDDLPSESRFPKIP